MRISIFSFISLLFLVTSAHAAENPPRLVTDGNATKLYVDDQPFLILGGELGNSTSSDPVGLARHWETFERLNMNTVLATVSWELIEPREGEFDFSSVDELLKQARGADKKLVLLWFGSWKNSMSSYVPAWVKRDTERFPRARTSDGTPLEILTPFSSQNRDADQKAFKALMDHLAKTDRKDRTVVMVQVENEIGMLPEARDHSSLAQAAWNAPVPQHVRKALGVQASKWSDLTTDRSLADEYFMAWQCAQYVEAVTAAGKEAYDIPMYVNAALPRPNREPGAGYPSAGPLPHLAEIWHAGAPSIDFLAPDIYFDNFVEWMTKYAANEPLLFIPEANRAGRAEAGADAFFAVGELDAIGFSPFSIEDIQDPEQNLLSSTYRVLAQLSPLILDRMGTEKMSGFRPPVNFDGIIDDEDQPVEMGAYRFNVRFIDPWTPRDDQNVASHGGLILQIGPEEFIIAGHGITLTFDPLSGNGEAGIESAWEGEYLNGKWQRGRLMNGDQTHQGRHVRLPPGEFSMQRVKLYTYE